MKSKPTTYGLFDVPTPRGGGGSGARNVQRCRNNFVLDYPTALRPHVEEEAGRPRSLSQRALSDAMRRAAVRKDATFSDRVKVKRNSSAIAMVAGCRGRSSSPAKSSSPIREGRERVFGAGTAPSFPRPVHVRSAPRLWRGRAGAPGGRGFGRGRGRGPTAGSTRPASTPGKAKEHGPPAVATVSRNGDQSASADRPTVQRVPTKDIALADRVAEAKNWMLKVEASAATARASKQRTPRKELGAIDSAIDSREMIAANSSYFDSLRQLSTQQDELSCAFGEETVELRRLEESIVAAEGRANTFREVLMSKRFAATEERQKAAHRAQRLLEVECGEADQFLKGLRQRGKNIAQLELGFQSKLTACNDLVTAGWEEIRVLQLRVQERFLANEEIRKHLHNNADDDDDDEAGVGQATRREQKVRSVPE